MTPSVWDSPDLKVAGNFVTFTNPGDTITGTVTGVRAHHWDDGSTSPQVFITTAAGVEHTITAGQALLKAALAEKRPDVGDTLTVTFTKVESRGGGKTLKHFDVDVTRGTGKPAAATANGKQGFSDDPPPF